LQARSRLLRLVDLWRLPFRRNRLRRLFSPPAFARLNAGLRRVSSRPLRSKIAAFRRSCADAPALRVRRPGARHGRSAV